MKKIISLSSGCSATYTSVIPKNWKTAGKDSLLKDWTIYYYFEDPLHKKQYPKGKRIRTKGMNEFKTLGERREATEILLQGIVDKLVNQHWNPLSKSYMQSNDAIDGSKSLLDSLIYYSRIKQASKSYTANIKSMIGFVEVSIYALQFQYKSVNTVTRKGIKAILRHQQETRNKRYI